MANSLNQTATTAFPDIISWNKSFRAFIKIKSVLIAVFPGWIISYWNLAAVCVCTWPCTYMCPEEWEEMVTTWSNIYCRNLMWRAAHKVGQIDPDLLLSLRTFSSPSITLLGAQSPSMWSPLQDVDCDCTFSHRKIFQNILRVTWDHIQKKLEYFCQRHTSINFSDHPSMGCSLWSV